MLQDEKNNPHSLLGKMVSKDNQHTVERYSNTYEFIFENFINPIFKAAESSQTIPQDICDDWKNNYNPYICPNHLRVKPIRRFFEDNQFQYLRLWVSDVNVRLRNSLIHEKYYIRDDIIHYYYKKQGQIIFETISAQELREANHRNTLRLFTIPVVVALKLIEDENLLDD